MVTKQFYYLMLPGWPMLPSFPRSPLAGLHVFPLSGDCPALLDCVAEPLHSTPLDTVPLHRAPARFAWCTLRCKKCKDCCGQAGHTLQLTKRRTVQKFANRVPQIKYDTQYHQPKSINHVDKMLIGGLFNRINAIVTLR